MKIKSFILVLCMILGGTSQAFAKDKYATLNAYLESKAGSQSGDVYRGVQDAEAELASIQKMKSENCFYQASQKYHIDPWLLFSISLVESGLNPNAKAPPRKDGNRAMGLMQFDSTWIPIFKKRYNVTLQEKDYLDGCKSIMLGAWVLADNFYRNGFNWQSIGMYNAIKNKKKQELYAEQVYKMYELVMKYEATGEIYTNPKAPLPEYYKWNREWQKKYYS